MIKTKSKFNWDALGITASVACAIHCALLPFVLSSLPLFGINIIDNPVFEYSMIFIAFIIGIIALSKGKKLHHSSKPMILFSIGMVFLFGKEIFHQFHLILLIPAVFFILYAHFVNFKLVKVHD